MKVNSIGCGTNDLGKLSPENKTILALLAKPRNLLTTGPSTLRSPVNSKTKAILCLAISVSFIPAQKYAKTFH